MGKKKEKKKKEKENKTYVVEMGVMEGLKWCGVGKLKTSTEKENTQQASKKETKKINSPSVISIAGQKVCACSLIRSLE